MGEIGEIGERGFCAFCARLFFAHSLFFGCANFLQAIVTAVFALDRAFILRFFFSQLCSIRGFEKAFAVKQAFVIYILHIFIYCICPAFR